MNGYDLFIPVRTGSRAGTMLGPWETPAGAVGFALDNGHNDAIVVCRQSRSEVPVAGKGQS